MSQNLGSMNTPDKKEMRESIFYIPRNSEVAHEHMLMTNGT